MPFTLSVRNHDELKAVVLAFTRLDKTLKRDINAQTRAVLGPVWQQEINARLRTPMDSLVIGAGVRVKAGNPPVVQAAQSRKAIGGRLRPATDWAGWEFGSEGYRRTTYTRKSKNGGTHKVTRNTMKQMPPRYRTGRVAYPALAKVAPRMAALWVQTVVRAVHQAAEGRD
ncbi:hypothetical protein [Cellulomonas sp. SG140]|uniref:hypothetical protein n=1 Tax=Cellulomonas sp. SG140 TaxID=2976536 RepID=UPI0021E7F74B|nr:hypothetical protein [Cellulomonas sp. SG140]